MGKRKTQHPDKDGYQDTELEALWSINEAEEQGREKKKKRYQTKAALNPVGKKKLAKHI